MNNKTVTSLSRDEKFKLETVMRRAQEFEALEEKHLLRQPLEGQLSKYTNVMKGWQYRWFVLTPDLGKLEYFEKEEHKKLRPSRGFLSLMGAFVSPSDEDNQTFTVNSANGEQYRLKAFDARERQHWVNRIRATAELVDILPAMVQDMNRITELNFVATDNQQSIISSSILNSFQKPQQKLSQAVTTCLASASIEDFNITSIHTYLRKCLLKLSSAQESCLLLANKIERSEKALDRNLLVLKATSFTALSSLQQCLSVLQHQTAFSSLNVSKNVCNELEVVRIIDLPLENVLNAQSIIGDNTSLNKVNLENKDEINLASYYEGAVQDTNIIEEKNLENFEEQKPIILQLLSQLKLGMDLTKVVLPTFILERRSLLEMFADCMSHPQIFLKIPDYSTPEQRMLGVLEWYLTSFHASRQGSIAKKPYNPIIGETFHCCWNIHNTNSPHQSKINSKYSNQAQLISKMPDQPDFINCVQSENITQLEFMNKNNHHSNDIEDGDEYLNLIYCAEQVSHHPPVSAFYFESREKQISMEASIYTESKFLGMSIGVNMIGKIRLKLLKYEEVYILHLPSVYARSILTMPWVELGDRLILSCTKTGYSSSVVFHTKPFYGGRLHRLSAEVRNEEGEVTCHVNGEWNSVLEFKYANGNVRTIDTRNIDQHYKKVRPLDLQDSMESRRLWYQVSENLAKGNIKEATIYKELLEDKQRKEEQMRTTLLAPYKAKFFKKDDSGDWHFIRPLTIN